MFKIRNNTDNLFTSFLGELCVPYTQNYSKKAFNEHPYKNTMYGISKLLREYSIPNAGYSIQNKNEFITQVEPPFIAHVGKEFVVVYNKKSNGYLCWRNGKSVIFPFDDFCKLWSGAILIAEPTKQSIEPSYKKHRFLDIVSVIEKCILILLFLIFYISLLSKYPAEYVSAVLPLVFVNLVGVYITSLILKKENHIHNKFSDQICSLFKKSDCNNVLESSAALFLGIVNWSVLGLSYFISNLLLIMLFPQYILYYSTINMLILPFSIWSIWYQKMKAKSWCPLCLTVLLILWCLFTINVFNGFLFVNNIILLDIIYVLCVYTLPLLSLHILLPYIISSYKVEDLSQQLNSIRLKDMVFSTHMTEQARYDISYNDSQILFGNLSSKNIITIFSNPHCNPCALMHRRVHNVLESNKNLCIQYIFSSFDKSLDSSCLFLIAVYLQSNENDRIRIFDEWFDEGRTKKEMFMSKYNQFVINDDVRREYSQHLNWNNKSNIGATPKVFLNGIELPEIYKIEDMHYFFK